MKDRHDKDYNPEALEAVNELLEFLCGGSIDGITIRKSRTPKLSRKKAFSIIWFLQEHMGILPDHHEMCDICDTLYDSEREGDCLDYGKSPYHFCENCMDSWQYKKKDKANPDKPKDTV